MPRPFPRFSAWWRALARELSPPQDCFLCGALDARILCTDCLRELPRQTRICLCCGCRLSHSGLLCGECQQQPRYFSQARAVFSYEFPVDRLIVAAKFYRNLAVLNGLGEIMAAELPVEENPPDVWVPVPMHASGLRRRGYNQALELTRQLARAWNIPPAHDACVCVRRKRRQARLSDAERRRNVRGAFRVLRRRPTWRHVGLVDDVMTTGATVNELAKVWLRAGAEQVSVWCCARRN